MTPREAALAAHSGQEPLVRMYRDAADRIVAEMETLAGDPQRTARVRRLHELRATIEAEMDRLDVNTDGWFRAHGTDPYYAGFAEAARDVSFSMPSRASAQRLADDLYDDLLSATRYVRRDTRRFIQEAARVAAQSTVLDRTAPQAGREMMRRLIDEHGIKAVTYRNGATHPLGEYSQMAIRTKTALAFNEGAFDGAPDVEWWECWDGPDCGLEFHEDGTIANGLIMTKDQARAYPISHPNCRRAWGPRSDVTSKTAAAREQGSRAERQGAAVHAVG